MLTRPLQSACGSSASLVEACDQQSPVNRTAHHSPPTTSVAGAGLLCRIRMVGPIGIVAHTRPVNEHAGYRGCGRRLYGQGLPVKARRRVA